MIKMNSRGAAKSGSPDKTNDPRTWKPGLREFLLTGFLALVGFILVIMVTRLGAFWSDDTYYYILPARQFMNGEGFHPSPIFGPVLPFLLTFISIFNIDPLVSVRWLNAVLFSINILLIADITRRITRSRWAFVITAALVVLADVVIEIHGWAMSEGVAIFLSMLAVDFLLVYLDRRQFRQFAYFSIATGFAVLARFAVLPLIPAIMLILLLYGAGKKLLTRIRDCLLFAFASLLPFFIYLWRNAIVSGSPLRYQHYIQTPFDRSQLTWFLYQWFSLFIPGRFVKGNEFSIALLSVLALLISIIILYRAGMRRARPLQVHFKAGVLCCAAMIIFSGLMLYLARGLTELTIFNSRYLIPPFLFALILLISGGLWAYHNVGKVSKTLMLVFIGIFLVYYGYRTYDFVKQTHQTGLGYSNIGWHESETIQYLVAHPEITDMVSTGEMGIYFWTGRMPTVLAAFTNPMDLEIYLCQHHAPFFLMNQMPPEMYGMTQSDAISRLSLVHQFNDGSMYTCPVP